MAKSRKTSEKVRSSFQIAVLFEGTGLDGDSSSNVGRLARICATHEGESPEDRPETASPLGEEILSRILDPDGNPVPPEVFRDAPTT